MKRLLLALIVSTFSASVAAEWVKIAESDKWDTYVNSETIRKYGNLRKVWTIRNYKVWKIPNFKVGTDIQSFRTQVEFDCREELQRDLYRTLHSGEMASGKILTPPSNEPSEWSPVPPDTVEWRIMGIVCAK